MDQMKHLDLVNSEKPHVLLESLEDPEMSDEKRHHLKKVLRIEVGSLVTATDGKGRWALFDYAGGFLEAASEIFFVSKPSSPVTIAFSLTKSGKPDFTIQKLTELGVDRIVVFPAENSVPLWDLSKLKKKQRRYSSISRSALEQSKGVWLPDLAYVNSFAEVAKIKSMCIADIEGEPINESHNSLAIGPEGGWSTGEYGFRLPRVSLHRNVLRSETAAVAAAAVLTTLNKS